MTLRRASICVAVETEVVKRRKRRWSGNMKENVMCVRKKVK